MELEECAVTRDDERTVNEEEEMQSSAPADKEEELHDLVHTDSEGEDNQLLVEESESDQVEVFNAHPRTEGEDTGKGNEKQLKRDMSLLSITALVVGSIIGSGIFFTPSVVLQRSGSVGVSLIAWFLGMFVAVGGGLCYCELSLLMKNSGGDYWYLKHIYQFGRPDKPFLSVLGPAIAFLFMWTSVFILRPAAFAIISLVFGRYLATVIAAGNDPPESSVVMIAVAEILFLSLLNCFNVKLVSWVMTVLSFAKLVACAFIVILGIWQLIAGTHIKNFTQAFSCTSINPGELALAFYALLWAYNGWNIIGLAVEEVKNENRSIPLSILIGIPVVGVCYLLVNVAFFAGLSRTEILKTEAIGTAFGWATLGQAGLIIIPLLVCTSALGAAHGEVYTASRLIFAAARDGALPEALSGLHIKQKTPVPAVLFVGTVSCIYAVVGNVSSLINSFSAAIWIFYGLNFAGIIILRVTEKKKPRPYKVWLFMPIVMLFISVVLVLLPVVLVPDERVSSLVSFVVILLGLPGYFFLGWSRLRPQFINKISEVTTVHVNNFCNSSSSREDYVTSPPG